MDGELDSSNNNDKMMCAFQGPRQEAAAKEGDGDQGDSEQVQVHHFTYVSAVCPSALPRTIEAAKYCTLDFPWTP